MNITEHEMRGLLAGKCLPGDMRVNEELPVYLVRKFAELKTQRDALAAENATLISAFMPKEIPTEATDNFSDTAVLRIDGDEFHSWQWVDNQDEVIRGVLNFFKPKTPVTDAYLNSARADAVKEFAHQQRVIADSLSGDEQRGHRITACRAEDFAAQLRAGEPS